MSDAGIDRYLQVRDEAAAAVGRGELERALELFQEAERHAAATGDASRIRIAACNRAALQIELGERERPVAELRGVLMSNLDVESSHLAAYTIARAYELSKDYRKALFYARIAIQRLTQLERRDWVAESHNQIGNLFLAQSEFVAAREAYDAALAAMPEAPIWERAQILDNLGYCHVVEGRGREGIGLLHASLRILRRDGARRYEMSVRLDLCFAWLDAERLGHARRHGEIALTIAEELGDHDAHKNALCLLAQLESLAGGEERARGYLSVLGQYFPNDPLMCELLLRLDVRRLINLKA